MDYAKESLELHRRLGGKIEVAPRLTVTDRDGGENVISVEPGRIRISDANCPDHVCVDTGWISDGVIPIVCLPHQLVIRIEGGGNSDIDIAVQ